MSATVSSPIPNMLAGASPTTTSTFSGLNVDVNKPPLHNSNPDNPSWRTPQPPSAPNAIDSAAAVTALSHTQAQTDFLASPDSVALAALNKNTNLKTQVQADTNLKYTNLDKTVTPLTTPSSTATVAIDPATMVLANPLNDYVTYTYHIKFWMTGDMLAESITPASVSSVQSIQAIPKVIIAESGVTAGFNIKDFNFKNLVGTGNIARNMPSVHWDMVITEPYGFSLPDRINSAAQEYGMGNWMRAKYFIEIYFCGYDEGGNQIAKGLFNKLYRVNILDMDIIANEAYATYTLNGIFDGHMGFTDEIAIPDSSIHVTARTVPEFFASFETALNANAKSIWLGGNALTTYKIVLPDSMKDWTLNSGKITVNSDRQTEFKATSKDNQITVTLSKGTDIGNVVNYVVSLSNQGQQEATGTSNNNSSANTSMSNKGLAQTVNVHSQVKHVGWDLQSGDYIREVTYTLIPYLQTRVRDDVTSVRAAEKPQTQIEKINFMLTAKRLRKKYDWIYTGQNTEVIKFDFKINNFYTISTRPFAGLNTYTNQAQGETSDANTAAWKAHEKAYRTQQDITKNLSKAVINDQTSLSKIGTGEPLITSTGDYVEKPIEQQARLTATNQLSTDQAALINSQKAEVAAATQLRNDQTISFANPSSSPLSNTLQAQALIQGKSNLQTAFESASLTGTGIYAEDQKINPASELMPFKNVVKPQTQANTIDGDTAASSAKTMYTGPNTDDSAPSRTLYAAVLGNYDSYGKEMINITLDIRGDPYWMGYDNIEQLAFLPNSLGKVDGKYAEYLGGDTMFYLHFRTGESPAENTGLMAFNNSSQFTNGYYMVTEVINNFSEGKFTQTLKSMKDTMSQVANSKAEASKTPAVTKTPATVVTKPPAVEVVPDIPYLI